MNISTVLRELRNERDIYQKELAAYLNVSIGTISNYEKDVHQPDLDTLIKLAEFYGVTTDFLLGLTSYPGRPQALSQHITASYSMSRFFQLLNHLTDREKAFLAKFLRCLEAANGLTFHPIKNSSENSKNQKN
ncbi:MAG: helix-turn-helix domain-containing protein [Bacteroidales bacterium]|nr:helix-turn-helix domain-containing protein [Lachnoclostridium sp.]MCM1466462.1 helix-turn-helix domain-containing protein [Bacteroidales bacterium]